MFRRICTERGLQYDNEYEFLLDPALADLEDVMTSIDVDYTLFEKLRPIRDREHPYNVLVELIAFTINRALRGPPCQLHGRLVQLIKEDDVVVDFNYDLLIDKAMRSEGNLNDFGYNVNFFKVWRDDDWRRPQGQGKSLDLLKLHGSFNWMKCVECSCILLMDKGSISEDVFDINYLQNAQCPRCFSRDSMVRLLLPPIQTKEYNLEPYRFLWKRAAQKLTGIRRIVFLGYSFANTDFATKSLLRQILHYTPMEDLEVHFMNPSSEPEERFKKIFPKIKTPTRTEDLKEFLERYPEWRG